MIHPDEGMTIVDLPAKKDKVVFVAVEEKDSLVSWEYRTRAYDIGFQVGFVPRGGNPTKPVALIPHAKVDGSKETISGEIVAPDVGTIVLTFDNNHSRFYGTTSSYHKCYITHTHVPYCVMHDE